MAEKAERLISLDVFRGMTIAGMVLVNNPGSWAHIYDPLEHAAWHGMTPTDWIFPFFLFIVGIAIPIALGKYVSTGSGNDRGSNAAIYRKIITRALLIFALGIAMSAIPFFQFAATDAPDWLKMLTWIALTAGLFLLLLRNFKAAGVAIGVGIVGVVAMNLAGYNVVPYSIATMRIPGVLQRIAVCYLIVSIVFLHTNWKQQLGIGAALLLIYWGLMTLIPVPGCEVTTFNDKACNLAAWIDRTILTENHMWRSAKVYDPEGILSTLPALVTTIAGVLTGTWLRTAGPQAASLRVDDSESAHSAENTETRRLAACVPMFFFGTVLLAVGYIWSSYFPLNKPLWSSSYVLVTAGIALLVLAACYWLIDIKGYKRWAWPFVVFGANALPLFVFSGILGRMLSSYRVAGPEGQLISTQKWIFDTIYLSIAQPIDASLLYAISYILVWLFLMWLLYRKGIYLKV